MNNMAGVPALSSSEILQLGTGTQSNNPDKGILLPTQQPIYTGHLPDRLFDLSSEEEKAELFKLLANHLFFQCLSMVSPDIGVNDEFKRIIGNVSKRIIEDISTRGVTRVFMQAAQRGGQVWINGNFTSSVINKYGEGGNAIGLSGETPIGIAVFSINIPSIYRAFEIDSSISKSVTGASQYDNELTYTVRFPNSELSFAIAVNLVSLGYQRGPQASRKNYLKQELVSQRNVITSDVLPCPEFPETISYLTYEKSNDGAIFPHGIEIALLATNPSAKMSIRIVKAVNDELNCRRIIETGYSIHGLGQLKIGRFRREEISNKVTFIVEIKLPNSEELIPIGTLTANLVPINDDSKKPTGLSLVETEGILPSCKSKNAFYIEYGDLAIVDKMGKVGIPSFDSIGITKKIIAENMFLGVSYMIQNWLKYQRHLADLSILGHFAIMQRALGNILTGRWSVPLLLQGSNEQNLSLNIEQHRNEIFEGRRYWFGTRGANINSVEDLPRETNVVGLYYGTMQDVATKTLRFWEKREEERKGSKKS